MYPGKDTTPTYLEISKNQNKIGRLAWSKSPTRRKFNLSPASNYSRKISWELAKPQQDELGERERRERERERERENIIAMRNMVVHDAENFDLKLFMKPNLVKSQLWIRYIFSREYEKVRYDMRRTRATIKKYSVNKPP